MYCIVIVYSFRVWEVCFVGQTQFPCVKYRHERNVEWRALLFCCLMLSCCTCVCGITSLMLPNAMEYIETVIWRVVRCFRDSTAVALWKNETYMNVAATITSDNCQTPYRTLYCHTPSIFKTHVFLVGNTSS